MAAGMRRIRQNRYDNWYGYVGSRRVIAFGHSRTETAQQAAERWRDERAQVLRLDRALAMLAEATR